MPNTQYYIQTILKSKSSKNVTFIFSGVLSFEGRLSNSTTCSTQKLESMHNLMELERTLAANPQFNLVYTYSRQNAPAMKLLAHLIQARRIQLMSVSDNPSQNTSPGSTLYLGGPIRRQCQSLARQSKLDQVMSNFLQGNKSVQVMKQDCECRHWGFQFLRMATEDVSTVSEIRPTNYIEEIPTTTEELTTIMTSSSTLSSSSTTTSTTTTTLTTTTTTSTSTLTTTTTTETTTTTTETSTTTTTTLKTESSTAYRPLYTTNRYPGDYPFRDDYDAYYDYVDTTTEIENETTNDLDALSESSESRCPPPEPSLRVWQLLSISLGACGAILVLATFAIYVFMAYKSEQKPAKYEVMLPIGLIFLYSSVATFGMTPNVSICLLRRSLPGLGFTFAFVGIILQLVHSLNKNVYTVNNPDPALFRRCGLSRDDGLFVLGLLLASVQFLLAATWNGMHPPRILPCDQLTGCSHMVNFQATFFFSLCYPVFLGFVIFSLSGLSLKWRLNSSSALGYMIALTLTFGTWGATAAIQTQFSSWINLTWLYLICYGVATSFLLLLVYVRRIVTKCKGISLMQKELRLTSNVAIPEGSEMSSSDMDQGGKSVRRPQRGYANTFSSTSSFTLPSIIGNYTNYEHS